MMGMSYYQALFEDVIRKLEPEWEEMDERCFSGGNWLRERYPFKEHFKIMNWGDDQLHVQFSLLLPEPYLERCSLSELRDRGDLYELSVNRKGVLPRISLTARMDELEHSLYGFICYARERFAAMLKGVERAQTSHSAGRP